MLGLVADVCSINLVFWHIINSQGHEFLGTFGDLRCHKNSCRIIQLPWFVHVGDCPWASKVFQNTCCKYIHTCIYRYIYIYIYTIHTYISKYIYKYNTIYTYIIHIMDRYKIKYDIKWRDEYQWASVTPVASPTCGNRRRFRSLMIFLEGSLGGFASSISYRTWKRYEKISWIGHPNMWMFVKD